MNNRALLPGTRGLVLYLAQYHPAMKRDQDKKKSAWAAESIVYIYYSDPVLSGNQDHYKPFPESSKFHFRMGPCIDPERATESGPLQVRELFCACDACAAPKYDFGNCTMKAVMGTCKQVNTKRLPNAPPRLVTRGLSLATFAEGLNVGEIRAVRVALDQVHLEGGFWLAKVTSLFHLASADVYHGGELFQKGSLLVKINWLGFVVSQAGARHYELLPDEKIISVMAFIRIAPANVTAVPSRSRRFVLGESETRRIESSV